MYTAMYIVHTMYTSRHTYTHTHIHVHVYTHTHSPNRCSVLREDLKVLLCQSQWVLSDQLELRPLGDEVEERVEEDRSQSVTAVVGGVCHEDGDLREGGRTDTHDQTLYMYMHMQSKARQLYICT